MAEKEEKERKNGILNRFYQTDGQPSPNLSYAKKIHHQYMPKIVTLLKTIDAQMYPQNMVLEPTGSTYDGTNIEPIDLDTMIIIPDDSVSVAPSQYPGFFYLTPNATSASKYSKVMENGKISSEKFERKFYGDMQKSLNRIPEYQAGRDGTSLGLAGTSLQWAGTSTKQYFSRNGERLYSVDTTPTFKIKDAFYIPMVTRADAMTWRKSDVFEELEYLKNLDTKDQGVRRMILRILKAMKEEDSTFQCLRSYPMKTWVMQVSSQNNGPWKIDNLADRLNDVMNYAIGTLKEGILPHFYMNEDMNLYHGADPVTLQQMANRLMRLRPHDGDGTEFEQFFGKDF